MERKCVTGVRTIPSRFWIGFMAFAGCTVTFILRSNMSLNILAMVRPVNMSDADAAKLPDVSNIHTVYDKCR